MNLIEKADIATSRIQAFDAYDAATDDRLTIASKIGACLAATLDGLRVRAKIVAGIHAERDLEPEDSHTTDEIMLWATIRDLAATNI